MPAFPKVEFFLLRILLTCLATGCMYCNIFLTNVFSFLFSLLQHHPLGAFFRHKSPLLILPPPKGPSSSSLAAGPRRGGGGGGGRDELDLEGFGTGVGVGGEGERGGGRKRRRRTRGLIAAGKIPIRLSSQASGSVSKLELPCFFSLRFSQKKKK